MDALLPDSNSARALGSAHSAADADSLITIADVCRIAGFGRTWIYASVNANEFPQPAKVGSATRWSKNEVVAWVRERLKSRAIGQPWKR